MKFEEIAKMYYEDHEGIMKPGSFTSSLYLFNRHIKDYWAGRDVSEITSREVQKFYTYLSQKPKETDPAKTLAEHTVKDIIGLLKTICYHAMREGAMPEFSFKLCKPYGIREKARQAEFMPESDCKRLLGLCADGDFKKYAKAKIFALIALTSGLRIGEVCGLKWEDIDFDARTIRVRRTVYRVYDPETKASYICVGDPKTKTSRREAALLDVAAKTLKKYRQYIKPESDRYFVLGNEKPDEPRTLRQAYKRLLDAHGIAYLHPHGLRHTFCTNALAGGCDLKTVSALLGHSKTQITLDIYDHITQKQREDTVKRLNHLY